MAIHPVSFQALTFFHFYLAGGCWQLAFHPYYTCVFLTLCLFRCFSACLPLLYTPHLLRLSLPRLSPHLSPSVLGMLSFLFITCSAFLSFSFFLVLKSVFTYSFPSPSVSLAVCMCIYVYLAIHLDPCFFLMLFTLGPRALCVSTKPFISTFSNPPRPHYATYHPRYVVHGSLAQRAVTMSCNSAIKEEAQHPCLLHWLSDFWRAVYTSFDSELGNRILFKTVDSASSIAFGIKKKKSDE